MIDKQERPPTEQGVSGSEKKLFGEQAATHMPSKAADISTKPTELFEQTAPFWQQPPSTSMRPPFYPNPYASQTERVVLEYQKYLQQAGYEVEAIDLEFKFRTLVQSPGDEYERARRALEPVGRQLHEEIRQCEVELDQKKNEFALQMALARLPLPQPDKKSRGSPSELSIMTQVVENALTHDFATPEEICGQHGVTPTGEKEGGWVILNRIGQWLMDLLAPLFAGLILGVNIAAITGFLRLEDFRQGRQIWLVALAAFIGFFIEKLVGTVYSHLASSLAQAREPFCDSDEARPFPRLRATGALLLFSLIALLLGVAVVVVDALGLRMLHEQAVQQAKLLGAETGEVLPFLVYLIAGCVISLPYLIYKAMMSWHWSELRLRDARIAYLHWKHVEERRGESKVRVAFQLAQEVVSLQARLASLNQQLERVKDHLAAAYTQVAGCHQEFVEYWEALRDQLIAQRDGTPLERRGRARSSNHGAMDERPDTVLRRLMRAFRRG